MCVRDSKDVIKRSRRYRFMVFVPLNFSLTDGVSSCPSDSSSTTAQPRKAPDTPFLDKVRREEPNIFQQKYKCTVRRTHAQRYRFIREKYFCCQYNLASGRFKVELTNVDVVWTKVYSSVRLYDPNCGTQSCILKPPPPSVSSSVLTRRRRKEKVKRVWGVPLENKS